MLDNAMGSNLQSNQTKSSLEIEGLLLKLTKTLCAYLRDTHCGDYFTLIGSHKTCCLTFYIKQISESLNYLPYVIQIEDHRYRAIIDRFMHR